MSSFFGSSFLTSEGLGAGGTAFLVLSFCQTVLRGRLLKGGTKSLISHEIRYIFLKNLTCTRNNFRISKKNHTQPIWPPINALSRFLELNSNAFPSQIAIEVGDNPHFWSFFSNFKPNNQSHLIKGQVSIPGWSKNIKIMLQCVLKTAIDKNY